MSIEDLERLAMCGAEMPAALPSPAQAAYISFRGLYHDWKAGIVTKEQAQTEKKQIIRAFKGFDRDRSIYLESIQRWNRAEALMPEVEKAKPADCPTCAACRKIIRILDGREDIGNQAESVNLRPADSPKCNRMGTDYYKAKEAQPDENA